MSKLAEQIIGLLRDEPLTVYQLAARLNRTEAGLKTMVFELRTSGYIEGVGHEYPKPYRITEKADGPIRIEWKKTKQSRASRERRETAPQATSIGFAIANRPQLQKVWGGM